MPRSISEINAEHLDRLRAWYDAAPSKLSRSSVSYRAILAHYYNLLISPDSSVLEVGCGSGELLGRLRAKRKVGIDLSERQIEAARERSPDCEFQVQAAETLELGERFDFIVISDTLNFAADVQQVLEGLHALSVTLWLVDEKRENLCFAAS